jgi:hypothetical protein
VILSEVESACSAASKIAASFQPPDGAEGKHNCFVVVHSENGYFADLVSKYRPAYPVFVACPDDQVLRTCRAKFGQLPIKMPMSEGPSAVVAKCVKHLSKLKHDLHKGVRAIFVAGDRITGDPFVRIINTGMSGPHKSGLNVMTASGSSGVLFNKKEGRRGEVEVEVLALFPFTVESSHSCAELSFFASCLVTKAPLRGTRTSLSRSAPPTPTWT